MALNEMQKKERSEYLEKNLKITECSQRKPYVFISYASDNWETVFKNAVVPLQREYGMRVYADKAFDKVNDKWIVPMLRNIRGADVILAFVSQKYIESYACFLELLTAVNNKKQVVFVALEDQLNLGNTTDQPVIERGVKNEILNQGANISTNTNNTSNDLMRAMKSAFTSLATLLEQDALSKYDISDAFINFFRDASINRKTINDLKAVKRTIGSISNNVFDPSLTAKNAPEPAPVQPEPTAQPADAEPSAPSPAVSEPPVESPVQSAAPAYQFTDDKKSGEKKNLVPIIIAAVCAVALIIGIIIAIAMSSSDKNDKKSGDESSAVYDAATTAAITTTAAQTTTADEQTTEAATTVTTNAAGSDNANNNSEDTYDGDVNESGDPNGKGKMIYASGDVYDGEWKDGERNGQGTYTWSDGKSYTGGWAKNLKSGNGKMTYINGDVYEGEWKNDQRNGQGTLTKADGTVTSGTWENSSFIG